ncbi:IS1634 family transposase [Mycobacterium sp.]|uniref:IS1634 family transposase n=1 Tax=Mycobacterium sp. TaxID=1785 RepID=UPI0031D4E8F1
MTASPARVGGPFQLRAELLGALPIVDHILDRLGLDDRLESFVPTTDHRVKLRTAKALGVLVRNLALSHQPVYALGEWAAPFDPALLGLQRDEVRLLNDDRVGRALGLLFDADRASLLNRLVLDAVKVFSIDCSQLHNDSTSVSLSGAYPDADGHARGTKRTVVLARGHSKDFRPDLKQLVFILSVAADGAVPIACRIADGNVEDSTTHVETWDSLVALFGRSDFLYVADAKLATKENMAHIVKNKGRFVSVLPKNRKEDGQFRRYLVDHEPVWTEALRRRRRIDEPDDVYEVTEAAWPSAEGYRVIWVRSSAKVERDAASRRARIAKGIDAIDQLNQRLASPKTRMKSIVAIEKAAREAVESAGAARWVRFSIDTATAVRHRQETRGRPGANTRYRRIETTTHRLHFSVREDVVADDACSDGCWPLITCDRDLSAAEVLVAYKHQPHLERRNHMLKGPQAVAPMFLHDPARIEGLMTCHFIAMLVQALVERELRRAMATRGIEELPLYPEGRGCSAPSAPRVFDIFGGLARQHLISPDGSVVQIFPPELTKLQRIVLNLLGIRESAYE